MYPPSRLFFLILIPILFLACKSSPQPAANQPNPYQSASLQVKPLAANSYQHISYKQTRDFGNVPCNGLVVRSGDEVIVFDTPTNDSSAAELIRWIGDSLGCRIRAVIPTHFHDDCLGGLKAFHAKGITSYGFTLTRTLAGEMGYEVPKQEFGDSLVLRLGRETVLVKHFGEGHTRDNVVGYFSGDLILFGGCLVKELDASRGYLGDANLTAWPGTVETVKAAFPAVKIVVPGHGEPGTSALLDYTIRLFKAP